MSAQAPPVAGERSFSAAREVARTAPARCLCYAAFSELLASPHEADLRETVGARVGAADGLPFAVVLDELLREHAAHELEWLQAEYSGLFEVGSQGPPAPIREDLQTGQRSGTREDIVRFYDYFNYRLGDRFAWAPDHLSVELEFMHFLAWHEACTPADAASYQLAQADFAERHLQNWVPGLAETVGRLAPDSFYSRVLLSLQDFVANDLAWQRSTILTADDKRRPDASSLQSGRPDGIE